MKVSKISNPSPRFTPTRGQAYFYVNSWEKVSKATWNNHSIDLQRLRHGKVFADYKSANAARKAAVALYGATIAFARKS